MMTLSFTRTFAAPNVLEDVSIDSSGSWIMSVPFFLEHCLVRLNECLWFFSVVK